MVTKKQALDKIIRAAVSVENTKQADSLVDWIGRINPALFPTKEEKALLVDMVNILCQAVLNVDENKSLADSDRDFTNV